MVKVFLDTDVSIDFLAFRQGYYEHMKKILLRFDTSTYSFMISESSVSNLIYILSNTYKIDNVNELLIEWIEGCKIASTAKSVILKALRSPFKDKEDACQYFVALHNDVDYFITRNKKDYAPYASIIPVYTPHEFLALFGSDD
ncbi:MAG: PIN domain-containing protein [Bacteroidota bacterium]